MNRNWIVKEGLEGKNNLNKGNVLKSKKDYNRKNNQIDIEELTDEEWEEIYGNYF